MIPNKCWCGARLTTNVDKHGASPKACTTPCTGNANEKCGGPWAMYVYEYELGEGGEWLAETYKLRFLPSNALVVLQSTPFVAQVSPLGISCMRAAGDSSRNKSSAQRSHRTKCFSFG